MATRVRRVDLTTIDPDDLDQHIVDMCDNMQSSPTSMKLAAAFELQYQVVLIFQNDS